MLHSVLRTLKSNLTFLLFPFIYWLTGGLMLTYWGKANFHLWLNNYHQLQIDLFFKYFTEVGNGITVISVIVLLFILSKRNYFVILLLAYLTSTVVVQTIKFFIPDNHRPYLFFPNIELYRAEGVNLLAGSSFPSGHAASAFLLFFLLAIMTNSTKGKFILGIIAVLAAYSRVYLNQHFWLDTAVGGFIGVVSVLLSTYWTERYFFK